MNKFSYYSGLIREHLELLNLEGHPDELYQPVRYILSLSAKRMRPTLVLMSCDMFNGDVSSAIKPAIGIEIFHNFTLLHDDIMDNAPLRRAHPTVHEKWNRNIAILAGDAMFVKAYEMIVSVDKEIIHEVLDVFNGTAI